MNQRMHSHYRDAEAFSKGTHRDTADRVQGSNLARLIRRQRGDLRSILAWSSVGGLGRAICPSAVAGFVVAIVVDPIERVVRGRALAHIREECLEVNPAGANLDSAVSVPRLPFAPGFHAAPGLVGQARPAAAIVPVRGQRRSIALDGSIGNETTTTLDAPGSQERRRNHGTCTTGAEALNCLGIAIDAPGLPQHREPTPLAPVRHRYVFGHGEI